MRQAHEGPGSDAWAVVLAGGDGTRLRPLTRLLAGDDRPKQFCRVLDGKTLLEQTRERLARVVPAGRTLIVVNRAHERFYGPALGDTAARGLVVQPANRGTAPAILYALLRVAVVAPAGSVIVSPSDHYVSDDVVFMAHVQAAVDAVQARPELVILLGIAPDRPEVEYGWIEPGEPIPLGECRLAGLSRVRRFWEKPPLGVAEQLHATGCLWNSFVMVARVPALLSLVRQALPALDEAFAAVRPALDTGREREAASALYARCPSSDFSREVLAAGAANLAVLRVGGVAWSDLGDPARVQATRHGARDHALAAMGGR